MTFAADRVRENFYAEEERVFTLQLCQGLEHPYSPDCPVCDGSRSCEELDQHLAAIMRADATAEEIAAAVQAAKEKKDARG